SRDESKRAQVILNSMLHRMGSMPFAVTTGLAILLIPASIEVIRNYLGSTTWAAWASKIHSGVLATTSILTTLTVAGAAILRNSTAALNTLDRFQSRLETAIAQETKKQHDKVARAEKELVNVRQRLAEAERRLAIVSDRAAIAEQDYQNDTARGRLN